MDYCKVYNNICERGKEERQLKYKEVHHIIPKCLGGNDSPENLTTLTYREHYLAHWLLIKMHPNDVGVNYAFLCMIRKQPNGSRMVTGRMFETVKTNFSKFKSWHCKNVYNPGKTEASRKAARKRMKTRNPNQGGITNHTSYPVVVYYENGSFEEFAYMKEATEKKGYPYSSLKVARRSGGSMKKYGITKVVKKG